MSATAPLSPLTRKLACRICEGACGSQFGGVFTAGGLVPARPPGIRGAAVFVGIASSCCAADSSSGALETRYTLISEFFSQAVIRAATKAAQITSELPAPAEFNPLTFILSPLPKGRGELSAIVFTRAN